MADEELAYVAAVSAGGNLEVGRMVADAMARVGRGHPLIYPRGAHRR